VGERGGEKCVGGVDVGEVTWRGGVGYVYGFDGG